MSRDINDALAHIRDFSFKIAGGCSDSPTNSVSCRVYWAKLLGRVSNQDSGSHGLALSKAVSRAAIPATITGGRLSAAEKSENSLSEDWGELPDRKDLELMQAQHYRLAR